MSTAASPTESLLRRKQEQWEREKAEAAVWFPFGAPGGGAPNRKPPSQVSTPEGAPRSVPSTPVTPSSASAPQQPSAACNASVPTPQPPPTPQMVTSPQQALPYAYLPPMPLQSPTMYGPPQQFVYAQSPHGHPIPVEVVQGPHGPILRYPVAFPSPTQPALTVTSPNASVMTSSYTEQWTNRVPFWSHASPNDSPYSPDSRTHLPPINGEPQNRPADDNLACSTLSSSFSSLNSNPCRQRPDENDEKQQRLNEIKNAYEAQIEEKRRRDAELYEAERRLEQQRHEERRQLELQLEKESEIERAKGKKAIVVDQAVALEKFRREAEQLKKAKLYRHVMQSPDDAPKYEKEVFGEDGCQEAARVLKEVEHLERQKKWQAETLNLNSSKVSTSSSPCSTDRSKSLPPKHLPTVREDDNRPIRPALAENNTIRNLENLSTPQSSRLQRGRSVRIKGSPRSEAPPRRSDSAENLDRISAHPTNRTPATAPAKAPVPKTRTDKSPPKSMSRARRTASRNSIGDTPVRSQHPAHGKILYSYDADVNEEMVKSVDSGVGQTDIDNDHTERKGSIDSTESSNASVVTEKPYVPPLAVPPSRSSLLRSKEFGGSAGLFEPVQTRNRRMRFVNDAAPSGSVDIDLPSTPPTIITPSNEDDLESPPRSAALRKTSCDETSSRFSFSRPSSGKVRSRVNSTTNLGMNGSDASPPRQSAFAKKIAETSTNSIDKPNQDISTPPPRRQFDTTSLSPGLTPSRLRLSFASLCGSENGDAEKSPSVSPKPFNSFLSRTPQYRSFNMKRNTKSAENQQKILDQLAQLRAQLKDKQKRIGQTLYAELDHSKQDSVAV
uniref:HALZ domain-containing protein n=2 Tax=Steinernema glaseri TaxID=37863 RepID=A0A1I8ATL8_9BILA